MWRKEIFKSAEEFFPFLLRSWYANFQYNEAAKKYGKLILARKTIFPLPSSKNPRARRRNVYLRNILPYDDNACGSEFIQILASLFR